MADCDSCGCEVMDVLGACIEANWSESPALQVCSILLLNPQQNRIGKLRM